MKNKERIGTCALCKSENVVLEESHIIPKFVFRRIIKKSATGFMRNIYNPNQRVQDGDKQYLLCGNCEDLFNVAETKFANNVFHPFKQGSLDKIKYDSWLNYFIASVNWRNLYLDVLDFQSDRNISNEALERLLEQELLLRQYLLNEISSIHPLENHVFFFEDIETADQQTAEQDPHTFFRHGSFGYTLVCESYKSSYTVSNLTGILICTILKKSVIEEWKNTYVRNGKGNLDIKNQRIISPLFEDIIDYMNEGREYQKKISVSQREKISDSLNKKLKEYNESEYLKDKILDNKLRSK